MIIGSIHRRHPAPHDARGNIVMEPAVYLPVVYVKKLILPDGIVRRNVFASRLV